MGRIGRKSKLEMAINAKAREIKRASDKQFKAEKELLTRNYNLGRIINNGVGVETELKQIMEQLTIVEALVESSTDPIIKAENIRRRDALQLRRQTFSDRMPNYGTETQEKIKQRIRELEAYLPILKNQTTRAIKEYDLLMEQKKKNDEYWKSYYDQKKGPPSPSQNEAETK